MTDQTVSGDMSWLERYPGGGGLMAFFRNTTEVVELWQYCHANGCHSRPNGTYVRESPSPIANTSVQLSDTKETILIHQTDCGKGPLQVWIYRNVTSGESELGYLGSKVMEIIEQYNFPCVGLGEAA